MLSQFDYLIESPAATLFSYLPSSLALYVELQLLSSSIKRCFVRGIITPALAFLSGSADIEV